MMNLEKVTINEATQVTTKLFGKEITYIETCAGYGTSRLALEEVGHRLGLNFKCVGMSEINPTSIKAYNRLHGETINLGDMTKIDWSKHYCDILSLTFPCQCISQANHHGTGFEEGANQKSSIVWSLREILRDMPQKPKLILMENVKAILFKNNKPTLDKLVAFLEQEGYSVKYKCLNAADYGIPQNRERVFILATLGQDTGFGWPEAMPLPFELKDILEKNPDAQYYLTDKAKRGFITRAMERGYAIRVHNPSLAKTAFTISTKSGGRNYDNFLFEEDVTGDTFIKVSQDGLQKAGVDLHTIESTKIRKLTPKEVMTLTGLTSEQQEKLKEFSPGQISFLMGNGIVVNVLTEILYEYFKKLVEDGAIEN